MGRILYRTGITVPIKALAEGAERIARGELGHRVDVLAEDELALLVWTFNEMSAKLEANAAELSERRRYIETILLSLPTGVISIDENGRVGTINPSAKAILRLAAGDYSSQELNSILNEADFSNIEKLISRAKRIGHASDQTKLADPAGLESEGLSVAVTVTALPENSGVVIVMEDLSELIAAQRASAWQEVARRMAARDQEPAYTDPAFRRTHRQTLLRSTCRRGWIQSGWIGRHEYPGVAQGTETILREVQSLKTMVDEFSRFARLPTARLELWDVNEVIRQAAALYNDRQDDIKLTLSLADDLPPAMIDDEQLKRVFVNPDRQCHRSSVRGEREDDRISSRNEIALDLIVVEVSDNGRGIDQADFPKLFQPYFSTKGRGTGLGLAIVNRIIAEHNGKIKAVPNQPHGAKFVVELPVAQVV